MNKSTEEILALSAHYVLSNYGRSAIAVDRALGSTVVDANGREYIDLFPGFGALGLLGHSHPEVTAAIAAQAAKVCCHGNLLYSQPQAELAQFIVERSFPGKVFFAHSGAEADEAALKTVRKAAGPGRYKIISFDNCFHGRTMGGLSLTPASFQCGFEPMLPGNIMLPFGDLSAVEKAIDSETAGIFVEPIQGEGGINVAPEGFLQGLRDLCEKHGLLLVFDEVWSAPGRTGKWFAWQHDGVKPDVMTLGKAVGGGLPVSACVIAEKWTSVMGPGTHGCTMGGNPLCAAAALCALQIVDRDNLLVQAIEIEEMVREWAAAYPSVLEVRGRGVMLGLLLDPAHSAAEVKSKAEALGLFVATGKNNVVRLAPALNISERELREGLTLLGSCL